MSDVEVHKVLPLGEWTCARIVVSINGAQVFDFIECFARGWLTYSGTGWER